MTLPLEGSTDQDAPSDPESSCNCPTKNCFDGIYLHPAPAPSLSEHLIMPSSELCWNLSQTISPFALLLQLFSLWPSEPRLSRLHHLCNAAAFFPTNIHRSAVRLSSHSKSIAGSKIISGHNSKLTSLDLKSSKDLTSTTSQSSLALCPFPFHPFCHQALHVTLYSSLTLE